MKKNFFAVIVLSAGFGLIGCVSAPKGPVRLELKSPRLASATAYRSVSHTDEYEGQQMVKQRDEAVDFLVETKPLEKSAGQPVEMVISTVDKNGLLDLHSFGFPELKESLEFHYQPNGTVLKAGSFAKQSLFFVPPLPLPADPVEPGDTWELDHTWASTSGLDLRLNVVGIHKGYRKCGDSSPCAVIEISGAVKPAAQRVVGMDLTSSLKGELLFSVTDGDVYSSKVSSSETLIFPNRKVVSKSCMVSVPTTGRSLKDVKLPKCELAKD